MISLQFIPEKHWWRVQGAVTMIAFLLIHLYGVDIVWWLIIFVFMYWLANPLFVKPKPKKEKSE